MAGKSTLVRDIFGELGAPEYVELMKGFPCEKRGDVLILGRYPEGEIFVNRQNRNECNSSLS